MSQKIYIGYGVDNTPTSVLIADSREKAEIAWAGMKNTPYTVEEIDIESNNMGVHGVVFLLTSIEMNSRDFSHRIGGFSFRKWKRGL